MHALGHTSRNNRRVLDVDEEAKVEESSRGTGVAAPQTRRQLQLERRQPVFGQHRDPNDPDDNVDVDRDSIDSDGTDDYDVDNATADTAAGIGARGTSIFSCAQKRQRDANSAPGTAPVAAPATAGAATIIVIAIAFDAAQEHREQRA